MSSSASLPLTFADLRPGDRLPPISGRTVGRASFACDSAAGRYLVFAFVMSGSDAAAQSALDAIFRERHRFDDRFASLFAVTVDSADEARLQARQPAFGIRFLWDFDAAISRACGASPRGDQAAGARVARRFWLVVDPALHVLAKLPFAAGEGGHEALFRLLDTLPQPTAYGGGSMPAPVLMLPNVFEQSFCRTLIDLYERHGGLESGVVRDHQGVLDPSFKRRKDHVIQDQATIEGAIGRISRRVIPELERLFFFKATRIERHIVGCYSAEDGAHFAPHRDNNYGLTMHRRFAVSINLNDGFEGGGVYFPEYSRREHTAPAGWALIFPCAALHAVSRVRAGQRYAYLPFLYDEPGAALRKQMQALLGGSETAGQPAAPGAARQEPQPHD